MDNIYHLNSQVNESNENLNTIPIKKSASRQDMSLNSGFGVSLPNVSSINDESERSTLDKSHNFTYGSSNETYFKKFFGYKRYPEVRFKIDISSFVLGFYNYKYFETFKRVPVQFDY